MFNPVIVEYSTDHIDKRFNYEDEGGRRFWPNTCLAPGGRGPAYDWNGHTRNWRFTREKMQELHDKGEIYYSAKGMPYRKNYLDSLPGQQAQNLWTDIKMTKSGAEKLGYPTQKPLALLERIIQASSNEGDVVLDPFCGCGTAIAAAEKLGRRWIGIDVTSLAVALQSYRLRQMFKDIKFQEIGLPEDLRGAYYLLETQGPFQFQGWALKLVQAFPRGGTVKKGADRGIDGILTFLDGNNRKRKIVLVQVKSGANISSRDIRDLRGTIEREGAAIGVFITLREPTRQMQAEAASAGYYEPGWWGTQYSRIQILTVEELLHGTKRVEMPPELDPYEQSIRVKKAVDAQQFELGL